MEHHDVLVVGAGISGISSAWHLQNRCPDRTFAILEGRGDIGGTWDLFRYPGVRSDSDMHTLGFSFQPWTAERSIADGPSIMAYLRRTVAEHGIDRHIRFHHRVRRAEWSTPDARWTLEVERTDTGEIVEMSCELLHMCSGYYSYRGGYLPDLAGAEDFAGTMVHPQDWPDDLDHRDRRVIVIGSGATAMTLVPAMAAEAAHVTMLQRSPTYVVARPDTDPIAAKLRRWLPGRLAYALTRRKNVALQRLMYRRTRSAPDKVRAKLLGEVRKHLGPEYDVDTHFTPSYDPWDQRLCLVPNADLFEAISSGRASVVTDHIDTITETGIRLRSGAELQADVIVAATGLQLVTIGEMDFAVDGEPVDFSATWTYKGLAYSGVPNLVSTFGYVAASWTLRADLISAWMCRLLNHMRDTNTRIATPRLRPEDVGMAPRPWIDDFSAGYMQRMMPVMPRQGDRDPWVNTQDYARDRKLIGKAPIDDGVVRFERRPTPVGAGAR